jgi:tetratricopeptide (TPR) repeat protein
MDSRTSMCLWMLLLLSSSGGCVNPWKKDVESGTSVIPPPGAKITKKEDGPKRDPKPLTEVTIGELKEKEADSDDGKKNPEGQSRLREEARLAYVHATKLDPKCVEAWRHLARLYAKIGDFDRAQETYKKLLTSNPKDAVLWYELGLVHKRKKDFPESIRCYRKALDLEPESGDYIKALGFTLVWVGELDQGLAQLKRVQGSAIAHYNIARVLLTQDKFDQARIHLQKALRENGNLESARELLTRMDDPNAVPGSMPAPPSGMPDPFASSAAASPTTPTATAPAASPTTPAARTPAATAPAATAPTATDSALSPAASTASTPRPGLSFQP